MYRLSMQRSASEKLVTLRCGALSGARAAALSCWRGGSGAQALAIAAATSSGQSNFMSLSPCRPGAASTAVVADLDHVAGHDHRRFAPRRGADLALVLEHIADRDIAAL